MQTVTVSLTYPMSYRYPAMSRFVFLCVSNFMRQWCVKLVTRTPKCSAAQVFTEQCWHSCWVFTSFFFFSPTLFSLFAKTLANEIPLVISSPKLKKKFKTGGVEARVEVLKVWDEKVMKLLFKSIEIGIWKSKMQNTWWTHTELSNMYRYYSALISGIKWSVFFIFLSSVELHDPWPSAV